MGWLDRMRGRSAERAATRAAIEQERAYRCWYEERVELVELIEEARSYRGADRSEATDLMLQLKRDERVVAVLHGCALIEPRRTPGQYQGGYQGFSFKVTKGVRYHTGGSRGTYTQGEERPTPIDDGTVTITTQRIAFQGSKQAREWVFAKLLGVQHDPKLPWTAVQVSNRQKVSGFYYDDEHLEIVRFRMALALAIFNDDTAGLVNSLERDLAEHEAQRPLHPTASGQQAPGETRGELPQ